jgi:twitching motility protein PilT
VVRIEDAVSCSPDVGDLRRRARNNGINPSHSTRSQLS